MSKKNTWTLFEILFMLFSIVALVVCFVLSEEKSLFSLTCSILGVIAVLTVAKGLFWAPYINLIYNTAYAILSYTQGFYGEFIIGMFLMNAICVITIISWLKNRKKEDARVVEINKIKGREYIFLVCGIILLTVAFYFILKLLNTNKLIVSTISLVGSVVASYLMLRRSSYYAIGFIFNDIVLIVMWSLNMVTNGIGYLPTVICFIIFLFNDVYGFIHWKIEEKKQSTTK